MNLDAITRPPVELHRLICATVQDPALPRRLREAPGQLYEEFGVPDRARELLIQDPKAAMWELNVHANLQFKFLAALGLLSLTPASIQPYLRRRKDHGTNS